MTAGCHLAPQRAPGRDEPGWPAAAGADEDSNVEGFYRRRLDISPGITGYWQALGASRIPLFEMVRLD